MKKYEENRSLSSVQNHFDSRRFTLRLKNMYDPPSFFFLHYLQNCVTQNKKQIWKKTVLKKGGAKDSCLRELNLS